MFIAYGFLGGPGGKLKMCHADSGQNNHASDDLPHGDRLTEDRPREQRGNDGLEQKRDGGEGRGQSAQRISDQGLAADVAHQGQGDENGPTLDSGGNQRVARQDSNQEKARARKQSRPRHDGD